MTATDAEGHAQSYAYDRLGRMTSRTDGLGATEAWTYDARGNRLSLDGRVSGTGDLVTWTYDAADRMLTRVADGSTTTYAYDENGNMTSAAVTAETITVTYDRLDRPLLVTPGSGTATQYGYGFTTVTRSDGAGSYSFDIDPWGRQTAMDPPGAGAHGSAWRPDGLPGTSTDPNGTTTTRTYDDAGRTTAITVKEGASNRAVIGYAHNRAGLARTHAQTITGASSGNGTASFAYDHLGRITGYDSPIGSTSDRDYAWAKVVNRTGVTSDPSGTPSTITYTVNTADRITADSPSSGTYGTDAQGRMTARPSRRFEWDSLGRLTTVKDGAGTTLAAYTYDALDRIRTRVSGGITLTFRYVGTSPSLSLLYDSTAGATDRRFTNDLAGQPVGYLDASAANPVSWVVDGHHDVVGTIGGDGDVGRWYRYDPDGTQVATGGTGAGSHQRLQSSYADAATGLVWMVTRWYDPSLGRFISEDSLLGEPQNPDSRHRYAYGEGDPVNTWDPDGQSPEERGYTWRLRQRADSKDFDWSGFNTAVAAAGVVLCAKAPKTVWTGVACGGAILLTNLGIGSVRTDGVWRYETWADPARLTVKIMMLRGYRYVVRDRFGNVVDDGTKFHGSMVRAHSIRGNPYEVRYIKFRGTERAAFNKCVSQPRLHPEQAAKGCVDGYADKFIKWFKLDGGGDFFVNKSRSWTD